MRKQSILILLSLFVMCGTANAVDGWTITELCEVERQGEYINVQISDKYIVWQANAEIFYYDGNSITQVTDNNYEDKLDPWPSNHNISGKNIVWLGETKTNIRDVFFYDGNSVTQLTDYNSRSAQNPKIFGTHIIWTTYSNDTYTVYFAKMDSPSTCVEAISMGYLLDGDCDKNCKVDLRDFALFADNWLECIDPNDEICEHPWE